MVVYTSRLRLGSGIDRGIDQAEFIMRSVLVHISTPAASLDRHYSKYLTMTEKKLKIPRRTTGQTKGTPHPGTLLPRDNTKQSTRPVQQVPALAPSAPSPPFMMRADIPNPKPLIEKLVSIFIPSGWQWRKKPDDHLPHLEVQEAVTVVANQRKGIDGLELLVGNSSEYETGVCTVDMFHKIHRTDEGKTKLEVQLYLNVQSTEAAENITGRIKAVTLLIAFFDPGKWMMKLLPPVPEANPLVESNQPILTVECSPMNAEPPPNTFNIVDGKEFTADGRLNVTGAGPAGMGIGYKKNTQTAVDAPIVKSSSVNVRGLVRWIVKVNKMVSSYTGDIENLGLQHHIERQHPVRAEVSVQYSWNYGKKSKKPESGKPLVVFLEGSEDAATDVTTAQ